MAAIDDSIIRLLYLTLAVILGTLAAIVYSLRILVLLEKRIERVDGNIARMTNRIVKEELKIERSLKKGRR